MQVKVVGHLLQEQALKIKPVKRDTQIMWETPIVGRLNRDQIQSIQSKTSDPLFKSFVLILKHFSEHYCKANWGKMGEGEGEENVDTGSASAAQQTHLIKCMNGMSCQ